jgi:rhodanese-related sulfurtransferase
MPTEEPMEITPREVRRRIDGGEKLAIVDVREPEELRLCPLTGAKAIPMREVPPRIQELEALADEGPLMILCHHGVRSLQVAAWLRSRGIENCSSIAGGIDRWSVELDAHIPRY